jgi:sugar/nucleoside kinase (ribokinase family)
VILCVGEIMLDVLVRTGERHGRVEVRAGGTPVNAARAIGEGAVVVGRIGDDAAGAAVRADLARLDTRLVVDRDRPTGIYVELPDGTVRVDRGANAFLALDDVPPVRAEAVLVSGYVGIAGAFLSQTDVRWRAFVATPTTTEVPAAANVVFANDDEERRLELPPVEVLVVTHGAAGATLTRGGSSRHLEPTGTAGTGAGDALAGRVLASIVRQGLSTSAT